MKLGIDLGGTNIVAGICTESGMLLTKRSLPTQTGDANQICQTMRQLAIDVCRTTGIAPEQINQIGIGVPGTFDKASCTLQFGTNLGIQDVCFAEIFQPEFGCPVQLDNDGNCAALGEYISGAGRGGRNMVMLTLGTGIGGGIVMDGKLYTGENHIAGEIGHMVIQYGGLPCNCGKCGCFEVYASAVGLIHMAETAMQGERQTQLRQLQQKNAGKLTAKLICDARDEGDSLADRVFEQYLDYLACGINNIIAILQPKLLVIGGGLSGYGEKLMRPLRSRVERDLMKAGCEQTQLVLAELGNDAGLVGAAML